jgi:hypothetical protein
LPKSDDEIAMMKNLKYIVLVSCLVVFVIVLLVLQSQKREKDDTFGKMETSITHLIMNDKNNEHLFFISPDGKLYFIVKPLDNGSELSVISTEDGIVKKQYEVPSTISGSQISWARKTLLLGIYMDKEIRRCIKPELIMFHYVNGKWLEPGTYKMEKPISNCYHLSLDRIGENILLSSYNDTLHQLQLEEIDPSGKVINSSIIDLEMSNEYLCVFMGEKIIISFHTNNKSYVYVLKRDKEKYEISQYVTVDGMYEIVDVNVQNSNVLMKQKADNYKNEQRLILLKIKDGSILKTVQLDQSSCFNSSKKGTILIYLCPASGDRVFQFWDWGKEKVQENTIKMDTDYVIGWNKDYQGYLVIRTQNNRKILDIIRP